MTTQFHVAVECAWRFEKTQQAIGGTAALQQPAALPTFLINETENTGTAQHLPLRCTGVRLRPLPTHGTYIRAY